MEYLRTQWTEARMSNNGKKELIRIKNGKKSFSKTVLDDVNLRVNESDFLMVLGESGSGKSTLFNILSGIDRFDSGEYVFDDEVCDDARFWKHRLYNIGFVFQNYNLIPNLTARENIVLASNFSPIIDEEVVKRVDELKKKFNIEEIIDSEAKNLSGGEQQRVAIARSVFMNPRLILADEPTGNLDETNALYVMEEFKRLNQEGTTIIMITHDERLTDFASRVVFLKEGKISENNV